jgi:hypothetical protein
MASFWTGHWVQVSVCQERLILVALLYQLSALHCNSAAFALGVLGDFQRKVDSCKPGREGSSKRVSWNLFNGAHLPRAPSEERSSNSEATFVKSRSTYASALYHLFSDTTKISVYVIFVSTPYSDDLFLYLEKGQCACGGSNRTTERGSWPHSRKLHNTP